MNNKTNIPEDFDNLERYAPTLLKIGKANHFSVPDLYFEELANFIHSEIAVSNIKKTEFELPSNYFEKLPDFIAASVKLEELKEQKAFEVPADYFDSLPTRIQDLVFSENKNGSGFWNWLQQVFSPKIFAPTCSMVVILLALYSNWNFTTQHNSRVKFAAVDIKYIQENTSVNDIEEELIIEESDIANISSEFAHTETDSEEIENYLVENNMDINTIANEL